MVPLPPRIDAARALLPDVDTVPVLISELLSCPVLVWPHAADMPYALGPAVVIVPLLPLLVMALFWSTLRMGKGTARLWEALTEAPGTTLIVTPVLPATATTGVLLLPEHVTVVLLGGAVLLHCAAADDVKAANSNRRIVAVAAPLAIGPTVVSSHPRNLISERKAFGAIDLAQ